MHIQATATVLQRVTDCPTLGGQAWLNLNGIRNTNTLQVQIHKYNRKLNGIAAIRAPLLLQICPQQSDFLCDFDIVLKCKVQCSLCSVRNILCV